MPRYDDDAHAARPAVGAEVPRAAALDPGGVGVSRPASPPRDEESNAAAQGEGRSRITVDLGWGSSASMIAPTQLEAAQVTVELKPGAHLGSGSFADVYRGEYQFPGRREPVPVAFKIFRGGQRIPQSLRANTRAEAQLGARLRHPNLVQLFGVVERDDIGMSLVMELCEGGSLRQVLDDDLSRPLSWELRTRWLLQIAEGMAELHSLL